MTDPIADMLTRIRNGYLVRKKEIKVPYSRVKQKIAEILVKENFIKEVKVLGKEVAKKKLVLVLKYKNKEPVVTEIRRVSRPGLRVYTRADKVPPIRLGFGVTIISTSSGLMTEKEAKKRNLGGEIICQIW
jgi:small subunit ribosomal protein S8